MNVGRVVTRVALGMTAVSVLAGSAAAQAAAAKPTIALDVFTISAYGQGQENYAALGGGFQDLVIGSLTRNPNITVVERKTLNTLINEQNLGASGRTDPATAARIGRLVGAGHFLQASAIIDVARGTVALTGHSTNTETSLIEGSTFRLDGKTDDLIGLMDRFADTVSKQLRLPAPTARPAATPAQSAPAQPAQASAPAASRPAGQTMASAPAAAASGAKPNFKAVMLYAQALQAEDQGNKAQAIQLFNSSIAEFPNFDQAKAGLRRVQGS